MASKTSCCCGSCNFLANECNRCARCLPRYMCVTVAFVPGQYSTTCPRTSSIKLAYDCSRGSWVETRPHTSEEVPAVEIRLLEGPPCQWEVVIGSDTEIVAYDDLSTTVFEVEGEDGGTYEVTVNPGVGACYPYANSECSPCKCGTCMPSAYLFSITVVKPCIRTLCIRVAWDSDAGVFYGEAPFNDYFSNPSGNDIVITGTPLATSCAVRFTVDGLVLDVPDFDIDLEVALPFDGECDVNGFDCSDVHQSVVIPSPSRGGNCRAPYAITSPIVHTEIEDTTGANNFSPLIIEVSDGTCETCPETTEACPGACSEFDPAFTNDYCAECMPLVGSIMSDCDDADLELTFFSPPTGLPGEPGCQFDTTGMQIIFTDILAELNSGLPPEQQYSLCQKAWFAAKDGVGIWGWGEPPSRAYSTVEIGLVYLRRPCNGEQTGSDPSQYRLVYRASSSNEPPGCLVPPPVVATGFVAPTIASCSPFLLEFPWLDWNSGWPCPGGPGEPNPCEGQSGASVLRITR